VVVGAQSAGKSSLLEHIVGKEFLPRGSGALLLAAVAAGCCRRRRLLLADGGAAAGCWDRRCCFRCPAGCCLCRCCCY